MVARDDMDPFAIAATEEQGAVQKVDTARVLVEVALGREITSESDEGLRRLSEGREKGPRRSLEFGRCSYLDEFRVEGLVLYVSVLP
ncbi:MAG TPA: hypothetical protein VGR26_19425 [Acidimicrobiales bacterium]|nr:hypothetical protein [Acidimicrobiales bacterium]